MMQGQNHFKRIYFSLSVAHMVSEISGAIPSSLSRKFYWMEVYSDIYDWWLRTSLAWGLAIVLLD